MIFNDTPHFLIIRQAQNRYLHPQALRHARTTPHQIAVLAVRSLYEELALYPKPGLVSMRDNGSHRDMTATTLMRSLFSLRHYLKAMVMAGERLASFEELKQLGVQAEQRMLQATRGVNTHRGAIFVLGMLCAAAGAAISLVTATGSRRSGQVLFNLSVPQLRATLRQHWGAGLLQHAGLVSTAQQVGQVQQYSHGQRAARLFAVSGAREEGALGFPTVFDIGVPRWQATWARTRDVQRAQIDCLFALMASMSDTNLYHRGGSAGATWVKAQAQAFLAAGGSAAPDWQHNAERMHHACIERNLSPGGAADLLAASRFVVTLTAQSA